MRNMSAILLVLMLAAALLCGCASNQTENSGNNTTADPYENFSGWSGERELEIKRAYWLKSNTDLNGFDTAEVPMYYFGEYSGYEAVMPDGPAGDISLTKTIGGHEFKYGNANVILLFKEGAFEDMEDAAKEGKITQDDVDRIYEKYMSTKWYGGPIEGDASAAEEETSESSAESDAESAESLEEQSNAVETVSEDEPEASDTSQEWENSSIDLWTDSVEMETLENLLEERDGILQCALRTKWYRQWEGDIARYSENAAALSVMDTANIHLPVFRAGSLPDFRQLTVCSLQNLFRAWDLTAEESFFDDKEILIVYVAAHSGSFRFHISGIEREDGNVLVNVVNDEGACKDKVLTADVCGWILMAAVPRETVKDAALIDAALAYGHAK